MKHTNSSNAKNTNNPYRINNEIDAKEIRVIDQNGNLVGLMSVEDGIRKAQSESLDLVEVSPNSNPPVCKIANFGKMKYELQKKLSDAKKKQKVVELKEIKMTINIGNGDYDVKIKHAKENALIMHPGPMNRGIEIDASLADDINRSIIVQQVEMGVAVRMACLKILMENQS